MYRGTTPTLTFKINSEIDLTTMEEIWVTLKGKNATYNWDMNSLSVDTEAKTIALELSQEETLELDSGNVLCQLRFLDNNGKAYASPVKKVNVHDILREGVIS